MKKNILAVVGIFVLWSVVDMLVHGHLLMDSYTATAHLWRPMAEMKNVLMQVTSFVSVCVFVWIYACAVSEKSLCKGVCLGVQVGLLLSVMWAVQSYAYMPITWTIVAGWCGALMAKCVLAGVVVGKYVSCDVGCSKRGCGEKASV